MMMRDTTRSCRRFRLCYYGGHIEPGGETTMVIIDEKEQCLVDELTKYSVIRQLLKRAGIS